MKIRTQLLLHLCFFILIVTQKSFGQNAVTDSGSQRTPLTNARSLFYLSLVEQSPLYNGPEYNFHDHAIQGSAYFLDVNSFTPGNVNYNGILFNDVPILYDLNTDQVAVMLYDHYTMFSLLNEKVESFEYLNHHFINISSDTVSQNPVMKPGFYDELYSGRSEVLVKRSKAILVQSGPSGPEKYFSPSVDFYLKKNNVYYNITGKSELLKVLNDRKKEIEKYIRDEDLNYRKNPEEALVKIAAYYDRLTN